MQSNPNQSPREFRSYRSFLFVVIANVLLLALAISLNLSERANRREMAQERATWGARLNAYSEIQADIFTTRTQWLRDLHPQYSGQQLTQSAPTIEDIQISIANAVGELRCRPNAEYSQPLLANFARLDEQLERLADDQLHWSTPASYASPTSALARIDANEQSWRTSTNLAGSLCTLARNAQSTEIARYDPVSANLNWTAAFVSVAVSLLMMFAVCKGMDLRRKLLDSDTATRSADRVAILTTVRNSLSPNVPGHAGRRAASLRS